MAELSASIKQEDESGFEDDVSLSSSSPEASGMQGGAGANEEDEDDDDDDKYEDSLDLDTSKEDTKVWLVRLPKFLMEKWKEVDKISGEDLGRVRIQNQAGNNDQWKVKLVLNQTPEVADIPREYDISLVNKSLENTYVFTEQDMKGYNKRKATFSALSEDAEKYLNQEEDGADQRKYRSFNKNKRFMPYVKTIPKKTALVGTACHECLVMPSLKDSNYSNVVKQRKEMELEAMRSKVTFLDDIPGVSAASFGPSIRGNQSQFIRAQKKDIYKNGEGKATRISRNELLDLLFKLFEEYDYWSLKGLRERTKQPETYLKEVLDTMAILIKKGPYAMKYTLKPEFKQMKGSGNSLSALMGHAGNDSNEAGEEDQQEDADDDIEMLPVL